MYCCIRFLFNKQSKTALCGVEKNQDDRATYIHTYSGVIRRINTFGTLINCERGFAADDPMITGDLYSSPKIGPVRSVSIITKDVAPWWVS